MPIVPPIIWQPDTKTIEQSNIQAYMRWLKDNYALTFHHYDALWQWSAENLGDFWKSLTEYFNIQFHSPYSQVVSDDLMPNTHWFEEATLNYTEHIFKHKTDEFPAIIYQEEGGEIIEISWQTLENQVADLVLWLRQQGVGKGDRVVGYLPNIPAATVAMLATVAVGAVWSSASPDFGAESVIERFQQIEPKILIASTQYRYNGKTFNKSDVIAQIKTAIPSIQKDLRCRTSDFRQLSQLFEYDELSQNLKSQFPIPDSDMRNLNDELSRNSEIRSLKSKIRYESVPFSHPIWVLYSSGTTGKPKAITHSQGGILLEHLKYLHFHNDLKRGERFFWFSTTGWMMWNFSQSVLLLGGTVVIYNGSPSFPTMDCLWRLAEQAKINHFGTSAPYILACKKTEISPKNEFDLSALRSVSATGSPLPPEGFAWLNQHVGEQVWKVSMSGGTDLCTAFVGGVPILPVYEGEIQRPCLGAAVEVFDENTMPLRNEVGEMVLTKPMPSMPIYFWNDPNKEKYTESYFDMYPNIWQHGDWLTITDRRTLIISGRSDATLNRNGIRIGTAEIYRVIEQVLAIRDSLIVNIEKPDGTHFMPLFVQMNEGFVLNDAIKQQINTLLKNSYSPRYVPDEIVAVSDIPYTISGKKMEAPVKKILMGIPVEKVANLGAMRNPEAILSF